MSTYIENLRERVEDLKRTSSATAFHVKRVCLENEAGYLVPVCDVHRDSAELAVFLADWRENHTSAFPTQFKVTLEGTARWLRHGIIENPNRLLFLVCAPNDKPIGHVGLCDYYNDQRDMEAENIVRGVEDASPGIMSAAMRAMLGWAYDAGAACIHLRIFRDNTHAIEFYRRLGFRDDTITPLRKHVDADTIVFTPRSAADTAPPDREFLRMVHHPIE